MTQYQLADLLKISRANVAGWEQGRTEPGFSELKKLKRILNCTYEELLEGE